MMVFTRYFKEYHVHKTWYLVAWYFLKESERETIRKLYKEFLAMRINNFVHIIKTLYL